MKFHQVMQKLFTFLVSFCQISSEQLKNVMAKLLRNSGVVSLTMATSIMTIIKADIRFKMKHSWLSFKQKLDLMESGVSICVYNEWCCILKFKDFISAWWHFWLARPSKDVFQLSEGNLLNQRAHNQTQRNNSNVQKTALMC